MDIKGLLIKILTYPLPLRVAIATQILKKLSLLSYEDRLSIGATDRQNYDYCIFQAAKLATLLGYPRIRAAAEAMACLAPRRISSRS